VVAVQNPAEPIPGYQLLERLGQGGFGEVWKCRAPGGILKAIKIVHGCLHGSEDDELCVRQELKALERVKSVRHPYILSLERYDIIEGQLFIVMELADRSLWERYQECRRQGLPGIPREEILRYMDETSEALDLMNREYQLQHLDIKPQNLFLIYNHVKVGDFGLVKGLEGMQARVTSGVTPVYAAPETFEGLVSRFCDQYNLAIVYQELLTGRLPFNGKSAQQLMMQHLTGAPNLEALPPADRPAIARALSKKPEERFPSCMDLVRALRQGSTPVTTAPATPVSNTSDTAFVGPADFAAAKRHLGVGQAEHASEPAALIVPSGAAAPDRERMTQPYPVNDSPRKPHGVIAPAAPPLPPEQAEETGGGTLFPALVVGLGGVGLTILQQLRTALHKRIGPVDAMPHIRFLHIDTDAEALTDAAQGMPETRVREKEILVARLQRPSNYLKPGVEQQFLQSWFPLMKLKGLPRDQQTTGGWRALGRMALALHYSTIAGRLRGELETCTNPQALAETIKQTGLGLRSNRPRVYVVAHLGGGTGSGMFLDVAYGVKHLLAQMGQPRAEIVGVFLLPPGGRQAADKAATNAVAALTELRHFADGAVFSANYLHHQGSINERGPAFSRCFLLPVAAESGGAGPLQELTALAGDFLFRDLATMLGRTSDDCRAATGQGTGLSSFGAYWFTVPHRLLLQRVAQRFCHALVQGWQREDNQVREQAKRAWIDRQLVRWQLNPEALAQRLEAACQQTGGQTPKSACEALLASWAPGGKLDLGRDPLAANSVFKDVAQLVGAPGDNDPTVLGQALESAAAVLFGEGQSQLGEIALSALSEPKFRLTAVSGDIIQRQLGEALADLAKQHATLADEQVRQAKKVLLSMRPLLETLRKRSFLGWGQKSRAAGELLDWLGDYLGMCCRGLVYRQLGKLYQALHDNLHKHHRDVGCCWPRISQFVRSFEDAATTSMSHVDLGLGQYLLPPGCQSLEEGAAQVLARLTTEETAALQDQIHILMSRHFQQNLHVCTASALFFKEVQEAVYREVTTFCESQMTRAHAAEIYVQQHRADPAVLAELSGAFEEAVPQLISRSGQKEVAILAVPPGPEGDYFRGQVKQALPAQEFVNAASTDDIVFYREQLNLSIADIPQAGGAAYEAYQQQLGEDQFTPHTRTDVIWRPLQQ